MQNHRPGKITINAVGPVVPLGYRPAGWDRYKDGRGQTQITTDSTYFFIDATGRRRAFTFRQLYRRTAVLSLYGGRIETVLKTFPRARRGQRLVIGDVAPLLANAATSAQSGNRLWEWDPSTSGFQINPRGRWVAAESIVVPFKRPQ